MSNYLQIITKEYQPKIQSLLDDLKSRKDKDFFRPTGTQVYVGKQGSGKTVSAVAHMLRLKIRYPRSIICTNVSLTGLEPLHFQDKQDLGHLLDDIDPERQFVHFRTMDELAIALVSINNGKYGVVYLVDEIHTYFNALDSKNIPMYVFTEISQQRKQRKLIIGTSQLFMRLAKPFREQCDNIIVCNTHFGVLTTQKAYDGMDIEQDYSGKLVGTLKKRGWFYHTPEIRNAYDTYQKVVSGLEQYETSKPVEISIDRKTKKLLAK